MTPENNARDRLIALLPQEWRTACSQKLDLLTNNPNDPILILFLVLAQAVLDRGVQNPAKTGGFSPAIIKTS
jgi:hypothetical protein